MRAPICPHSQHHSSQWLDKFTYNTLKYQQLFYSFSLEFIVYFGCKIFFFIYIIADIQTALLLLLLLLLCMQTVFFIFLSLSTLPSLFPCPERHLYAQCHRALCFSFIHTIFVANCIKFFILVTCTTFYEVSLNWSWKTHLEKGCNETFFVSCTLDFLRVHDTSKNLSKVLQTVMEQWRKSDCIIATNKKRKTSIDIFLYCCLMKRKLIASQQRIPDQFTLWKVFQAL